MILMMFICFPVYVLAQIVAIVRLGGGWRWWSLLPVVPMIFVVAATIKAYLQQSNLWPLLLLFSSPAGLGYVVGVIGLHRLCKNKP